MVGRIKEEDLGQSTKLIELVRANPILWDMKSEGYHNKEKKQHKWSTIAIELKFEGEFCLLLLSQMILNSFSRRM
jgi:hypothetical protein